MIIHSDNGREFVNGVIKRTIACWPGTCKLINGRPRHPRSQGCIEKVNDSLVKQIMMLRQSTSQNCWVSWLPRIQCK